VSRLNCNLLQVDGKLTDSIVSRKDVASLHSTFAVWKGDAGNLPLQLLGLPVA
jgi:hypothetical protein